MSFLHPWHTLTIVCGVVYLIFCCPGVLTGNQAAGPSASHVGGGKLAGGAIAGIVVGAVAACVLGGALGFVIFRRRQSTPTG